MRRGSKKYTRRLNEDLPVAAQPTQPAATTATDAQQAATQAAGTVDNTKPLFTKDDVAKMTPGEIINYCYVSMPQNIDAETKSALLARADQLRKDAESNMNDEQTKERAKQILRSVGSTVDIGA